MKVKKDNVFLHEGLEDLGILEDPAAPEDQEDQEAHLMIQAIGEVTRMPIGMMEKDGSW